MIVMLYSALPAAYVWWWELYCERAVKVLSAHISPPNNTTTASLTCMPALRLEPKAFMCENRDPQHGELTQKQRASTHKQVENDTHITNTDKQWLNNNGTWKIIQPCKYTHTGTLEDVHTRKTNTKAVFQHRHKMSLAWHIHTYTQQGLRECFVLSAEHSFRHKHNTVKNHTRGCTCIAQMWRG